MNFMRFGCLCFASHSHLGSVLESYIFIWQFGYTCAHRDNDLLECVYIIYICIKLFKFKYVKRTQCLCRVVKNSFQFPSHFSPLSIETFAMSLFQAGSSDRMKLSTECAMISQILVSRFFAGRFPLSHEEL